MKTHQFGIIAGFLSMICGNTTPYDSNRIGFYVTGLIAALVSVALIVMRKEEP